MRFLVLCSCVVSFLWTGTAHGTVVHVPIQSGVALKPDETYTVTVDATEPTEIGWLTVQAKKCTMKCVQATDMTGGIQYSVATPLGAAMKYTPMGGKISVQYKNMSTEPVAIDVYRVQRTCDAEACKFIDEKQKGRWLVYKVDEFKSIATSNDGSYSVISGVTTEAKPFTVTAVWWTDNKTGFGFNCANFIKRYVDNHTPKDQYRPYIISGQTAGESAKIVLRSVDTCVPKAPKYGVPEENVFR